MGFPVRSTALGMALRAVPTLDVPAGAEFAQVTNQVDVDAFAEIHHDVFGADGRDLAAVKQFAHHRVLLASGVSAVIARLDGVPSACAMVIHSGSTAGIYWVATKPTARRRGLGALVTSAAARTAFDHGADVVVLQATPAGVPVYERLGFKPFTTYERLLLPAATSSR